MGEKIVEVSFDYIAKIHGTPLEPLLLQLILQTDRAYSYSWSDVAIGAAIAKDYYEPLLQGECQRTRAAEAVLDEFKAFYSRAVEEGNKELEELRAELKSLKEKSSK